MTFSVWDDNARFTQKYNIERNFASIDHFAALGLPVVPIFFCPREADLKQAAVWLREHPNLGLVGALAQFHRTDAEFVRLLDDFEKIQVLAGRQLSLLVIGCATREKIEEVYRRFPGSTIMTNKPVRKARSGHRFAEDLTSGAADDEMDHPTLLAENIELFKRFCSGRREGRSLLDSATSPAVLEIDPRQLLIPGFRRRRPQAPLSPQLNLSFPPHPVARTR